MQKAPKPSAAEVRRQQIDEARAKADAIRAAQTTTSQQTQSFSRTFGGQSLFKNGFVRS